MINISSNKINITPSRKLILSFVFLTVYLFTFQTRAAELVPEQGVLLSIGQDVDSINAYHNALGVTAGGVTNYIGINSLGGLTSNAEAGAGRNNISASF